MGFFSKKKEKMNQIEQLVKKEEQNVAPKKTNMGLKRSIGELRIAYEYDNEKVAMVGEVMPDYSRFSRFDEIKFELDPDNEYDRKSVRIMCNDLLLGYVFKGKIQDMIHDWKKKGDTIFGAISSIDIKNNEIVYLIAFYKNPFDGIDRYEKIRTKLINTSKKVDDYYNRQDICSGLERGDKLDLEYNFDTETYFATIFANDEAGEISKSVSLKVREKEELDEPVCLVEESTEDDNGKIGVDVLIYFK